MDKHVSKNSTGSLGKLFFSHKCKHNKFALVVLWYVCDCNDKVPEALMALGQFK